MIISLDIPVETTLVPETHNLPHLNGVIRKVRPGCVGVDGIIGLDSSAPIGPVLVSPKALQDPHHLEMKSIHNGSVVQETNTKYDPLPVEYG